MVYFYKLGVRNAVLWFLCNFVFMSRPLHTLDLIAVGTMVSFLGRQIKPQKTRQQYAPVLP